MSQSTFSLFWMEVARSLGIYILVSIIKSTNMTEYNKQIERESLELAAMTHQERKKRLRYIDTLHVTPYAIFKGGDGFGDVAFVQKLGRTAHVRSKTVVEILLVDKVNYLRIMAIAALSGGSDASATVNTFREKCELFRNINFPDSNVLSKYCDLRTIAPTET